MRHFPRYFSFCYIQQAKYFRSYYDSSKQLSNEIEPVEDQDLPNEKQDIIILSAGVRKTMARLRGKD